MRDKFSEIQQWYQLLQRSRSDPEIVGDIVHRKEGEGDSEIIRSLDFILASEFQRQKQYDDAERVLLQLSDQTPAEPYPLIALAEQKLYYENDPARALEIIDTALQRARASKTFQRTAIGVRARIAKTLRKFDLISEALQEIMTIKSSESRIDVGVERDFLNGLPPGSIDERLLRQYDEFYHFAARRSR